MDLSNCPLPLSKSNSFLLASSAVDIILSLKHEGLLRRGFMIHASHRRHRREFLAAIDTQEFCLKLVVIFS